LLPALLACSLQASRPAGYARDALHCLTTITYPGPVTVTFDYDAVGNRTEMVDSTGTTTYEYDALNRLTSVTFPGSRSTVV
jgi:YD repeat-containing protein